MTVSFGSVCSGIEAASVACKKFNIDADALWFSEIEPAPCRLLDFHYPNIKNVGDMTLIPEKILSGEIESPDILVGGTPCQAFSIAGKRLGLEDYRGNLTLTFARILDAMDTVRLIRGLDPAVCAWENVPGVLSSKDNAFGCFVAMLSGFDDPLRCSDGKWRKSGMVIGRRRRVAWVTLDAQFFGVAQRRRRVWVVAVDCKTVERNPAMCPSKILSIGTCLRRDTPSRTEKREKTAGDARFNSEKTGSHWESINNAHPCLTNNIGGIGLSNQEIFSQKGSGLVSGLFGIMPTNSGKDLSVKESDVFQPILTNQHGGNQGGDIIAQIGWRTTNNDTGDVCQTIKTDISHNSGPCIAVKNWDGRDVFNTLTKKNCGGDQRMPDSGNFGAVIEIKSADGSDITPTLPASLGHDSCSFQDVSVNVTCDGKIRRITPEETEVLQGFPIGYTACMKTDGHRYKALGNSWAVPQAAWVIGRVVDSIVKNE